MPSTLRHYAHPLDRDTNPPLHPFVPPYILGRLLYWQSKETNGTVTVGLHGEHDIVFVDDTGS